MKLCFSRPEALDTDDPLEQAAGDGTAVGGFYPPSSQAWNPPASRCRKMLPKNSAFLVKSI